MFPVTLSQRHFACPRCGHGFAIARLETHQRGWIALPQVAWEQAHSQVIRPFPKRGELRAAAPAESSGERRQPGSAIGGDPPPVGAARMRRERRRRRKRAALPLALIGLATVILALLVYPRGAMGQSGPEEGGMGTSSWVTNVAAAVADYPIQSATANPTPTETPTPAASATPTASATPLPARLQEATAWQATLEQAAADSHATQTLVAGNYAATQTALPPTLTAMAQERQATATQKAASATARAAGPSAR